VRKTRSLRAVEELSQAFVVLVAGGTALEMRAHAGHPAAGVRTVRLELDVLAELVEALVAEKLRPGGAEQPLQRVVASSAACTAMSSRSLPRTCDRAPWRRATSKRAARSSSSWRLVPVAALARRALSRAASRPSKAIPRRRPMTAA
jgi:hypothetical protein